MEDPEHRCSNAVDVGVTTEAEAEKSEVDDSEKAQEDSASNASSSSASEPKQFAPTGRPLIEPPMFDYDEFIEDKLPSDKRFQKLFPNDIEKVDEIQRSQNRRITPFRLP